MITVRGIPAYLQVAGAIGDRIASGEFARGSRLPTRVSFAGHYRVSETVVHSAMRALERQGLVRRDAHSTALFVAEEDRRAEQGDLAQVLHRLHALEERLEQLATAQAPTAPADKAPVSGRNARRRSALHGVSGAVLRGADSVLTRWRPFLGRGTGHAR
ncbi:GntR family transcriptional regulator [Streptomyces sp. NPDC004549]|uniref:GntR family transcriptional regulator n=1 Tax=Streptomyces sp. NPDC004549 TaxID=3154283 RepID=UPI0033BC7C34